MSILATTDVRRLDQRITFQTKRQTRNAAGGTIITWVDFATVWAAVDAVRANERYNSEQELSGNEYTVWIRWRGDLNSNMRILWKGLPLDIKGIPDNQRRGRFLSIFAESGINTG